MIEHVEVLNTEVEVGFAIDGEGADDGGVPVGESGPRREPLTTLPKPVPGPLLTGIEKAAVFSQLTQDFPAPQCPHRRSALSKPAW